MNIGNNNNIYQEICLKGKNIYLKSKFNHGNHPPYYQVIADAGKQNNNYAVC